MAFLQSMALGTVVQFSAGNSLAEMHSLSRAFGGVNFAAQRATGVAIGMAAALGMLVAVGGTAAAVLGGMSAVAADFDATMSQVAAVNLMTKDEVAGLSLEVRELASRSKFMASEVAGAAVSLSKAGLTLDETGDALQGTVWAAAAAGEKLESVTSVVVKTLRAFQLEASDASRIADVLALASVRTTSEIGSLGISLRNVSAIAHEIGWSLEDTVAAVAILQDVGIEASEAGTSMKTFATKLATPTKKAKALLDRLGMSMNDFKTEAGDVKQPIEVFKILREALSKTTGTMDRLSLSAELFGQRGLKPALALSARTKEFQELGDELRSASGVAEEMGMIMLDNLPGALIELKSALQEVSIGAIGPFNEGLKESVLWLRDLVRGLGYGLREQGRGGGVPGMFGAGMSDAMRKIGEAMYFVIEKGKQIAFILGSKIDPEIARWFGGITTSMVVLAAVAAPVTAVLGVLALVFVKIGLTATLVIGSLLAIGAAIGAIGFAVFAAQAQNSGRTLKEHFLWWIVQTRRAFIAFQAAFKKFSLDNGPIFAATLKTLGAAWKVFAWTIGAGATGDDIEQLGYVLGKVAGFFAWIAARTLFVASAFVFLGTVIQAFFVKPWMELFGFFDKGMGPRGPLFVFVDKMIDLRSKIADLISDVRRFGESVNSAFKTALASFKAFALEIINSKVGSAILRMMGLDPASLSRELMKEAVGPHYGDKRTLGGMMRDREETDRMKKLTRHMQLDAQQRAAATSPEVNVEMGENQFKLTIHNDLQVDGQGMSIATGQVEAEMAERAGFEITPWQRRQIVERGALLLGAY